MVRVVILGDGDHPPECIKGKRMLYLFLDFDGVTHPVSAQGKYFRQKNIKALEE